MTDRRSVWFELFYDLVFVAALVNGCHLFQHAPSLLLGGWLAATLVVMLVVWGVTALHFTLYRSANWTRWTLVLVQMFCVAIAILAIGRKAESLSDEFGFAALGVAFLSIALLYATANRSEYRNEARLVIVSSGLAGVILLAGTPFARSGAWISAPIFAASAAIGCIPIYWTLLGRLSAQRVDVEHFSERLGELLVIVLGESFVEVVIQLDGYFHIPNLPVLAVAFLITFVTWFCYFTFIEPRQLPPTAGRLRLWFLAFFLLIFGLMAAATRAGRLVVMPLRDTFTALPLIWTVMPFVYITVALTALYRISRSGDPEIRRADAVVGE